ncbi:MAG: hypothetical protein Q8P44_06080 [Dehalococcoidia bacterium]|nr:hypothetical protein [Dehalococcoidia bacterium]
MIKNILAVIGAIAIVILVVLLVAVFLVLPKYLKAEPLGIKPDVSYSTQGVLISATISEGDINAKLAEAPGLAEGIGNAIGYKTQNLRLKFQDDQLVVLLDGDIWKDGTWVTISIFSKLFISEGKPALEFERIMIGRLPLPQSLMVEANRKINQQLASANLGLPVEIKEIKVQEGKITFISTLDASRLSFKDGRPVFK